MVQACAEVSPKRCVVSRKVGREEQRAHVQQSTKAGGPHQNAKNESYTNGEFSVRYKEGDCGGVRQDEIAEHRLHKRIGSAFQKPVDPKLKSAVKRELRSENFVFSKDQKENSYPDAQHRHGSSICVGWGSRTRRL